MYSSTLSLTSALEGDGWSAPRPGRFTPGKSAVTNWRRLCGLQRPSGRVLAMRRFLGYTGNRTPDLPVCSYSS
jgi:hypothetical protein